MQGAGEADAEGEEQEAGDRQEEVADEEGDELVQHAGSKQNRPHGKAWQRLFIRPVLV